MARGEANATGCTYAEAVATIADARPELYKRYLDEARARDPRPAPRGEAERIATRPPGPATSRAMRAAEELVAKGGPGRVAFGDAVVRYFAQNPAEALRYLEEAREAARAAR